MPCPYVNGVWEESSRPSTFQSGAVGWIPRAPAVVLGLLVAWIQLDGWQNPAVVAVVHQLECTSDTPGGLVKNPWFFRSTAGLRICISNMFLGHCWCCWSRDHTLRTIVLRTVADVDCEALVPSSPKAELGLHGVLSTGFKIVFCSVTSKCS